MSYIEKEKLIKADIESIENRVRHAFNQGYDLGYKEGKTNKSENPTSSTTKNDLGVDAVSRQAVLELIANNDLSMGQVVRGIHALPSVTPQEPTTKKDLAVASYRKLEDCISRVEVRKAIDRYIDKAQSNGVIDAFISFEELVIKQLPSVDIKRGEDINVPTINEVEADDCVSRKNILESLNGAFPSTDWNKALFRKIVLDTPTVYPKNDKPSGKWINVSERLPEELLGVLVYCPTYDNIYCAYLENGEWKIFSKKADEVINEVVVAWMPPPEHYKMVEEQGETE